jgi:hypothetical protein
MPVRGCGIRQLSRNLAGAEPQASCRPRPGASRRHAPPGWAELRASALGQLHALGLSVQELSVPDPDRTCPHVGLVESQNPPPGTALRPGGRVTIRVYVTAQGGCF